MKRKTLAISVCLALVTLLALVPGAVTAQDKSPTIVRFNPEWQAVPFGNVTDVQVWVTNATNFYGAQFEFRFDPAVLQGITVTEGTAFTSAGVGNYVVTQNGFVGDRVRFAATLVGVAPPPPGDQHIATIRFRGSDTGMSQLQWINVILANNSGGQMPHLRRNGVIMVTDLLDIVGYAFLQGRGNHANIQVEVSGVGLFIADVTTDAAGRWAVNNAPAGPFEFLIEHPLYLAARVRNCNAPAGTQFNAPPITLLAGDLNADQAINIMDLTRCASVFGTPDPGADINADGIVDLLDLVLIGINFGEVGATDYPTCP
jgi:hypothetical protein